MKNEEPFNRLLAILLLNQARKIRIVGTDNPPSVGEVLNSPSFARYKINQWTQKNEKQSGI